MKKLATLFLLIVEGMTCLAHDPSPAVGLTMSGFGTILQRDDLGYAADAHLNLEMLSASLEYGDWSKEVNAIGRAYAGVNIWAQLCQLQYGFGEFGSSFRLRSNVDLLSIIHRGKSRPYLFLYPEEGKKRFDPILSLYGEWGSDFRRFGLGIGLLVW